MDLLVAADGWRSAGASAASRIWPRLAYMDHRPRLLHHVQQFHH